MNKLIAACSWLTEYSGRLVSWATLILLLLTLAVVILRYVFNTGATALQDTALYLHGAVFTLGAGYTLKHDAHVRVDIFYRRFSERGRHWVDFLGTLLLLLPVTLFIGIWCFEYVATSWRIGERSVEAGGLPLIYVQKSLLLILVVSLILQAVVELYNHGKALFGHGGNSNSDSDPISHEGEGL
ncbi:TRAP transporter small permease subunit [Shewanella submarina]|uniref:TRAP transporter small permease protein n=1 Tax=Shewanella submarina TaxID=2016376 RepID=A0ABV7G7N3_9GAMM|nr:TRAP transporter small permease subunit [Shewanella submarina]MCL1037299.1 TRAP transporter small permease subunit [Shewanella submarina]